MATLLSRSALLSAKLPSRIVPVPELGEDAAVRVQQMSVNTRVAYYTRVGEHQNAKFAYEDDQLLPEAERKNVAEPEPLDYALLSIIHCLVDEDRQPMFVEADMPLIAQWAKNAVTRIYEACLDINEYDKNMNDAIEAEKKAKV